MREKRDRLCAGLSEAGFEVFVPQGTYFVTDRHPAARRAGRARVLPLPARTVRRRRGAERRVLRRRGRGPALVRWACCKRPEVLDEAVTRLKALAGD
ncbi:MAG: hypothetical protein KatS3mg010_1643 [Acidimicrobiia bacterium]|nr:MAG: hypothetical protein KatS3mg010_1643 [Acidimicrobiia bacterium]